jgi:hypothetical protein
MYFIFTYKNAGKYMVGFKKMCFDAIYPVVSIFILKKSIKKILNFPAKTIAYDRDLFPAFTPKFVEIIENDSCLLQCV